MCDCLTALPDATDTGAALFAKNSDRPPTEAQRLQWLPPRVDDGVTRATYIEVPAKSGATLGVLGSRPWWMWGLEHGVNEAGVAMGNETIYTTLDPRPFPPALTGMDIVRLALERATTALDAVEVATGLLERHGQGGSGHHGAHRPYWSSFLVADRGSAWVVETSGREWMAEQVEATAAISNRTTIAAFDAAHRHPRQPVATLVDPRLEASRAVLALRPVTAAALRDHLRSHAGGEGGWTVCMHVDGVEATTAALVAELPASGRPVAHVLAGSPCRSLFVPVPVGCDIGEAVPWERFARLAAPAAPALRALEDQLRTDFRDDDRWPDEAWARVGACLDELGAEERHEQEVGR